MRRVLFSKTGECWSQPTSASRSRRPTIHSVRGGRKYSSDAQPQQPTRTNGSDKSSAIEAGPQNIERGRIEPTQNSKFVTEAEDASISGTVAKLKSPEVSVIRKFSNIVLAGPIGRLGRRYARVQERRPYVTQLTSSLVVYLCGDLVAQLAFPSDAPPSLNSQKIGGRIEEGEANQEDASLSQEKKTTGYDPVRTLRHLTVGATSSIPAYKWFMFLDRNFNFSSKFISILTKVVVQQACFTPIFSTYFFGMQSLLAGASLTETWERVKRAVPPSIINSLKLWPAVTAISFMYVPAHFRALFGGTVAVGWQTYLSWLNQKAAKEVAAEEKEEQKVAAAAGTASAHPSLVAPIPSKPQKTIEPGKNLVVG